MPVIINEFEVVADPPAEQRQARGDDQSATATPAPAQAMAPKELDDVIQHLLERQARLRAH